MPFEGGAADAAETREASALRSALEAAALALFARELAGILTALRGVPDGDAVALRRVLAAVLAGYRDPRGAARAAWVLRTRPLTRRAFALAAGALPPEIRRRLEARLGISFWLTTPGFADAVEQRTVRLAGYVTEATADRIRDTILEWKRDGRGIRDLSERIRQDAFGGDVTRARARRIARTEMVGNIVRAEHLTAVTGGVFAYKSWLHSRNRRDPRVNHRRLNGMRIPINERFANGLLHPHQEGAPAREVVNCGCSCLYHLDATG